MIIEIHFRIDYFPFFFMYVQCDFYSNIIFLMILQIRQE